jgi:hypothetical protein
MAAIGNAINHSARLSIWKVRCEKNVRRMGQKHTVVREKNEKNINWEIVRDFLMRGRYHVSHLGASKLTNPIARCVLL